MWDPAQYGRFEAERARPFTDLLAAVSLDAPTSVVDLGCGTGELTASLLSRWPGARITGVDSSAEMLKQAESVAAAGRLSFELADLASWEPAAPVDLVVSNAALQWVPGHLALLARFASWLTPGGVLAVQVPGNFAAPSHQLLRDLRLRSRWRDRVGAGADRSLGVESPPAYLDALLAAGLEATVWESTYFQLLAGPDPVLEWLKGTALRPVLGALEPVEQGEFLAELRPLLAAAYPAGTGGTVLPFRRLFLVGQRNGIPRSPAVVGLDHVQVAIARGGEELARAFYRDLLGLTEAVKPEQLRGRGGAWFAGPGVRLHVGAAEAPVAGEKAHIALAVRHLADLSTALAEAGYPVRWDDTLPGPRRLYTADPFGNRVELIDRPPDSPLFAGDAVG